MKGSNKPKNFNKNKNNIPNFNAGKGANLYSAFNNAKKTMKNTHIKKG